MPEVGVEKEENLCAIGVLPGLRGSKFIIS